MTIPKSIDLSCWTEVEVDVEWLCIEMELEQSQFGRWNSKDKCLFYRRTFFVTAACLTMIVAVGEFKLFPSQWNRIRGSVMIMSMKLISLAMDLDEGRISRHPPLIPVFGYLFHTATVIFGPWVSFYEYFTSIEPKFRDPDAKVDLCDPLWLLSMLRTMILSTMCLALSSCGLMW